MPIRVTTMKQIEPSFFDELKEALESGLAHARGEISLKTYEIPAPPPEQGAKQIAKLRKGLNMSQWIFAKTLNVSPKTVQGWEQGIRKPSQASLRLLQLIQTDPGIVRTIMDAPSPTRTTRTVKGAARK